MKKFLSLFVALAMVLSLFAGVGARSAKAAVTLTLVSPNGGSTYAPGTVLPITWTATDTASAIHHFTLYYTVDSGNSWELITNTTVSTDRSYSWAVPSRISSHAKVIVYAMNAASEMQAYDASDAFFTISTGATIPAATVLHPVSGDVWAAGTTQTISWSYTGTLVAPFHHFSVYYSMEDGRNGSWLVAGYSATTSLSWVVPAGGSTHAKIVVYAMDATSHLLSDATAAVFVVTPATGAYDIAVTAPASGASLTVGSTASVTWTTTGTVPTGVSYKVWYSVDGGLSWELAGTSTASPYSWTVPARLSSAVTVKVVALVGTIVQGTATSATFTIAPAAVAIATPAIAGVTAPVTGATPTATIAATTEYTATITWSGSPVTFAASTVYTATITLTPKTGYTLTGVAANFFTVAGATATNAAGSGVVSALFPITGLVAATAPSAIVLAVGSATPVGGVTNVAIPAAGATDTTGAVTGWVTATADMIKFTVTDVSPAASTITIGGVAYTSGADYTIPSTTSLTIVVTTTETGKATGVRTFTVTVAAPGAATATAPTAIVLAVGGATPVGGVTNVAIPAAGATDTTGAVTGWVVTTANKIKFTVTDAAPAVSTITIGGAGYASGADYAITAATPLTIIVTTTETGKVAAVRTFTVTVAAATATATAPSAIVLAIGSATPVGAVTNVAIPAAGATDTTGAVTGWVVTTANKIKFTVTDVSPAASTITIGGVAYASGADYAIPSTASLTIVVTTTETGKTTAVRTFTVTVAAATATPSAIVLAVGGATPVGGVTNVAIPAAGATDTTGAVTGWVVTTANKIKFTVTDTAPAVSTITIGGVGYASGADYAITAATPLTIVVTTTETGKPTAVRTFTVTVTAAAATVAATPSAIVLAVGSATPVGGVTNVAIPAAGATDTTGAVTGWVVTTANKIKFTVTDVSPAASTITIGGVGFTSGADYAIPSTTSLTIIVTTTETGKTTAVRTFTVTVAALTNATAPSAIVLAVGSATPVGGVTNVAIPAAGATDTTGAVTGWVTGSADMIKFTVTDVSPAVSTITIGGVAYTSGTNYTIPSTTSLTIVVTTTETGKTTAVRTFTVTVAAPGATAPSAIVLAVGSATPVGGVTNVAIPAAGATDTTGAVTGWVTGSADMIKFTVTDVSPAVSTITIGGVAYTSGTNYTIAATGSLTIVVTTTETGKVTGVRTFTVAVS